MLINVDIQTRSKIYEKVVAHNDLNPLTVSY